jgi:hypothetical protein
MSACPYGIFFSLFISHHIRHFSPLVLADYVFSSLLPCLHSYFLRYFPWTFPLPFFHFLSFIKYSLPVHLILVSSVLSYNAQYFDSLHMILLVFVLFIASCLYLFRYVPRSEVFCSRKNVTQNINCVIRQK